MSLKITVLICFALSVLQHVHGSQVWEFGADNNPLAVVVTNYVGHFNYYDKEQSVKILVPPCHVVSYVRVQVDNPVAGPNVYYHAASQTVLIQYQPWQLSQSDFNVLAKAAFMPNCHIQPL